MVAPCLNQYAFAPAGNKNPPTTGRGLVYQDVVEMAKLDPFTDGNAVDHSVDAIVLPSFCSNLLRRRNNIGTMQAIVMAPATRKSSSTADTNDCCITWLTIKAFARTVHSYIEPPAACCEKYSRLYSAFLNAGEYWFTAIPYVVL